MPILPEELSLHLTQMATADGEWLVAVDNVRETHGSGSLLLNLILEQPVDEQHFRLRRLGLMVPTVVILDRETCAPIIDRIRGWVETTEGDGFLDLVQCRT